MTTVFFFEAFEEEEEALRHFIESENKSGKQQISAGYTWKTVQEAAHDDPPAEIICIRTQSLIPTNWVHKGVKGVLTRSTGYDHVSDYRIASGMMNLPAGYLPLYCNRAVAEHALMLWSGLLRRLPKQLSQFRAFHRDGITGSEIKGKTLLVVGVGNIGYQVVEIGKGLGMKVLGVDIVLKYRDVDYVDIASGIGEADVIVCCMNLTTINKGYFNLDLLRKAKKSAVFVNVSRGELSPSRDLLLALENGYIAAAGLDVYDQEKEVGVCLRNGDEPAPESPAAYVLKLAERDDVLCTPHNAFNSSEAVLRKSAQSVQSIRHFLEFGHFKWELETVKADIDA